MAALLCTSIEIRTEQNTENKYIDIYIYTIYIYITYIIIFFKSFLNNLRNVLLFVLLFESLSTVNYQNSYSSSCHTIITIIYTPQTNTHTPYTPPQSHITPTTTHTHTHRHTYKLTRSNENAKDFFNWFKKKRKNKAAFRFRCAVIGNRQSGSAPSNDLQRRREKGREEENAHLFFLFFLILYLIPFYLTLFFIFFLIFELLLTMRSL